MVSVCVPEGPGKDSLVLLLLLLFGDAHHTDIIRTLVDTRDHTQPLHPKGPKPSLWGPASLRLAQARRVGKNRVVDRAMAAAPMVSLHVTLLDKGQSSAVGGCASLDACVWTLGEQVGMLPGLTWMSFHVTL